MPETLSVSLSLAEWQVVVTQLAEGSIRVIAPTFEKVQQQLAQQISEQKEPLARTSPDEG